MNGAAGLVLIVIAAAPASAQKLIGEARVLGTAAWAPGADAQSGTGGYPLPEGRAMGGAGAGLSFASGRISAGPEALVLRGTDRKMFALGGAARLHFAGGTLRPYLLVGAGVYTWNHKATYRDELSGSRSALAFSVGGLVSW